MILEVEARDERAALFEKGRQMGAFPTQVLGLIVRDDAEGIPFYLHCSHPEYARTLEDGSGHSINADWAVCGLRRSVCGPQLATLPPFGLAFIVGVGNEARFYSAPWFTPAVNAKGGVA